MTSILQQKTLTEARLLDMAQTNKLLQNKSILQFLPVNSDN